MKVKEQIKENRFATAFVYIVVCSVLLAAAVLAVSLTRDGSAREKYIEIYEPLIEWYARECENGFPNALTYESSAIMRREGLPVYSPVWRSLAGKGTPGYSVADINGDGVYEFTATYDIPGEEHKGLIIELYTVKDGEIMRSFHSDEHTYVYLLTDGKILCEFNFGGEGQKRAYYVFGFSENTGNYEQQLCYGVSPDEKGTLTYFKADRTPGGADKPVPISRFEFNSFVDRLMKRKIGVTPFPTSK